MSGTKRWRDSGHLERAVETAGGREAGAWGVLRELAGWLGGAGASAEQWVA